MLHRLIAFLGVFGALLATAALARAADNEPAWTDAQMETFLLRAEIDHVETLSIGVTGSRRATLSLNGRSHDAHVQTVDVAKHKAKVGRGTELNFRDSYRYNIAAYRLDRLLDLHMVPVSVERSVQGQKAAVTWWVDDVLMMEKERRAREVKPPHPRSWIEQGHNSRVFNQLIYNTDLNQGNILITRDWKVWLVDFTRAFRRHETLSHPAILVKIEGSLLDRLRSLSREQVARRLRDCLTAPELRALLVRRDELVKHFDQEIARRGAATVLFEPVVVTR